jgi:glycerophosphoryl diester phosphodiesterase
MQDEDRKLSSCFAGMFWPYCATRLANDFRAQRSGGFEGMALTTDGKKLLPLRELPLAGDDSKSLLIHGFAIGRRKYTGKRYRYTLDARDTSIGDFIMFNDKQGLVIERDGSQGDLKGLKAIFEIELKGAGQPVKKTTEVDLMNVKTPSGFRSRDSPATSV